MLHNRLQRPHEIQRPDPRPNKKTHKNNLPRKRPNLQLPLRSITKTIHIMATNKQNILHRFQTSISRNNDPN